MELVPGFPWHLLGLVDGVCGPRCLQVDGEVSLVALPSGSHFTVCLQPTVQTSYRTEVSLLFRLPDADHEDPVVTR